MEIKKIEGFEGYYITDSGKVLSRKGNETKWLKDRPTPNGYNQACLTKDGKHNYLYVHRIVAQAFIPNPSNLPEVDHINGVRDDNRVENLRWCTKTGNMNNPITKKRLSTPKTELTKEKLKNHPAFSKNVQQIDLETGNLLATFPSTHEAERQTGVWATNIGRCCLGKVKTAGGYKWRYAS